MKDKKKITNVNASQWKAVLEDLQTEIQTTEDRLKQLRESEVSVQERMKNGDSFPDHLFAASTQN